MRPAPSRGRLARFAALVQETPRRPIPEAELRAALGAVRFRAKQAASKLSPVQSIPRGPGRKDSVRPVAPFCASTYASFESCPRCCPFLADPVTGEPRGCFVAANVNQRRATDPLDRHARQISASRRPLLIALAEAFCIREFARRGVPQDGQDGGRDLRLHVSGDAIGGTAASILADAAREWVEGGGGTVWTFTHAWRVTPRAAWGDISVIASVETVEAARAARKLGYAVAVALPDVPGHRGYVLDELPGARIIPCPAERKRASARSGQPVTCVTCRLCLDDGGLRQRNTVVAFEAHSARARVARGSMAEMTDAADQVRRRLPTWNS